MRLARLAAAAILVLAAGAVGAGGVRAADAVTFGTPDAVSTYSVMIRFDQPVHLAATPSRVEILITTPGATGPTVADYDKPIRAGDNLLQHQLLIADGHIVPNTTFTAQWRVTDADGKAWLGPKISETYSDNSVDWKTLEGEVVRVHWYEGDDAFGRRALAIGDKAVSDTAAILGVTETEPIDFYIYADQDKFYDALGPGTRENVGGQAHADIRTMFALITPAEIGDTWVDVVVPHELTHLVFATATANPYHEPPHWMNEGLAVYLSEGYTPSYRTTVDGVAADGTIIPLEGLAGAFPTTYDRFVLGYAESVSAIDHIVTTHDRDALVRLIRSYATGVTDDEAFKAALGVDMAGFEAEWLASIDAKAPVQHGPQPAPPGPVPEGWGGAAPNPSVAPGTRSAAPGTGSPAAPGSESAGGPILVAFLVAAVLSGALVLLAVTRRRTTPPES